MTPRCLLDVWGAYKAVLGQSWFGPFFVLRFGGAFVTLLGSSWGRLMAPLAPFWVVLGSLGYVLGCSEGRLGASSGLSSVLRGRFGGLGGLHAVGRFMFVVNWPGGLSALRI